MDNNIYDVLDFLLQNFDLSNQIFLTLSQMLLESDFNNFVELSRRSEFDFNTQDQYGDTLIHYLSIRPRDYRFLEYISQFDVDMNIQNNMGRTPFDVLIKQLYEKIYLTYRGLVEERIIVALIDEGANPDIEKMNIAEFIGMREERLKSLYTIPHVGNGVLLDFLKSALYGLLVLLNLIDLILLNVDHVYNDLL
jgi:ankyrin repeat protein